MADSEEVSVSNDSEPLLSVRHLRKSYGDHEVLKDVSFDVKRGQVLVLLGPSGSGKSTLIRCLNGLETIQGGEIWFKGQKIANNSEKTWRKLRAEIGAGPPSAAVVWAEDKVAAPPSVTSPVTSAPASASGTTRAAAQRKRAVRLASGMSSICASSSALLALS